MIVHQHSHLIVSYICSRGLQCHLANPKNSNQRGKNLNCEATEKEEIDKKA